MKIAIVSVLGRNDILLAVDKDTERELKEVLCEGVPDCRETLSKVVNQRAEPQRLYMHVFHSLAISLLLYKALLQQGLMDWPLLITPAGIS